MNNFQQQRIPLSLRFSPVLLLAAVLAFVLMAYHALQRPPSFDGAMNLQVSQSLALGEGYRRTYSDRLPFPAEVQTNAPFTVPAAAAFRLFGVGLWQAQLAGLLYLAALLATTFVLVRKHCGLTAAAAATLLVALIPGLSEYGLNGYGEVPALFWAVLSLSIFPWRAERQKPLLLLLCGIFLGLAVSTKTVMLICAAAFGFFYLISIFANSASSLRIRMIGVFAFAAGFLLPLLIVELWRAISVGGWESYKVWWNWQLDAIGRQAGSQPGYKDTPDVTAKLVEHLRLLAKMQHLSVWALSVWIVGPVVMSAMLGLKRASWNRNAPLFCLLVAASIYLCWWLLVTPTQKAWHRRILAGNIMLAITWVWVIAALWKARQPPDRRYPPVWMVATAALFASGVGLTFLWRGWVPELKTRDGDPAAFNRAVSTLKGLPAGAQIFGIGWYSAPALSLFSGRNLEDLNNVPIRSVKERGPAYVVLDSPAIAGKVAAQILSSYRSEQVFSGQGVQIYKVDFNAPSFASQLSELTEAPSAIRVGHAPDFMLNGFYSDPGGAARWMSSRGAVLLRYDGPLLAMTAQAQRPNSYMKPNGVHVFVSIEGCPIGSIEIDGKGRRAYVLSVPERCKPRVGEVVAIEIEPDNLLSRGISRDPRALSILMGSIGFIDPCTNPESCKQLLRDKLEAEAKTAASVAASFGGSKPKLGTQVAPTLTVTPNHVDLCSRARGNATVRVHWDIPNPPESGWRIWVSSPDETSKIWTAGKSAKGSQETGPWARDGSKFIMKSMDGAFLASTVVRASPCP